MLNIEVSMYLRTLLSFVKCLQILWYNYISWSGDHDLQTNWLRKLKTIVWPIHFVVLDFNYSIYHLHTFLNNLIPVTFYPLVSFYTMGDNGGIEMVYPTGYSISWHRRSFLLLQETERNKFRTIYREHILCWRLYFIYTSIGKHWKHRYTLYSNLHLQGRIATENVGRLWNYEGFPLILWIFRLF